MKKKVLSLVLALLMTASAASTVLADDVVAIAEDTAVEAVAVDEEVEAGQYDKAIEFLANYKIFKGYSADDTGAEDLIQRYQMALFVARIATGWTEDEVWEDGPENWSEFSDIDVDPVNKYFGALSFANQKGIIEGYGNGKFGPTDGITYQNALTMVVRTLGYDTLDWPWGYIQKAVELGLTDGITGVAYQDELTRGEVAQIIYNTLFAKMKDGSNLALKNFGIEFGWEKVVITASNINTFVKLADDKGTGVEKNLVEFKLLNDDGSLGDDAYRALASDFDLDYEAHEDDLAVGNAYYVLFEKDADSALAEIVAVEDLYIDTLENTGKLNDYEIKEFFDKYALVDKYSANNYVNVTSSTKDEVLVWDKTANITVMEDAGHFIAIDWSTGDILVPKEIKDNKVVDKDDDGDVDWDDWKIEWHRATYNGVDGNERYYKVEKDADGKIIYGVNWMSEKEFEDTYASVLYKAEKTYKGFSALTSYTNTAYAALDLFDTNLDGIADRGLYESYALGYFETVTEGVKCGDCDKKYDSWKITKVGTEDKYAGEKRGSEVFNLIPEGTCSHAISNAWFAEGYEPTVDEDGEYVDNYVIYGYDAETKAIKIVKTIDGTDADSYVATGVLRAYNASKESVTIGEDKLTMDYDDLAGTGFYKVNDSNSNKNKYDAILKAYFNQFVKYVVVDGELVHIELAGKPSATELIVVDGYKGISADGYIVVNGYSTADLEYAEFRLGSIDGWKKGDAYYNAYKYESDLARGTVYEVVTYDEDEDLYFVEVVTEQTTSGEWLVEGWESSFSKITTDDGQEYDNYFTKNVWDWEDDEWGDDAYTKMTSSDKWVFVTREHRDDVYSVITVFEGKLPEGALIKGDFIKVADNSYIVVNAEFNSAMYAVLDRYAAGLVILYKDAFDYADYNGEYAEDDRYILGGVEYITRGFDVLTGDDNVNLGAFNDDFAIGYAYYTEDGILPDAQPEYMHTSLDIVNMVNNAFSADSYVAKYIPSIIDEDGDYIVIGEDKDGDDVTFDALYNTKDGANKKAVEAMLLGDTSLAIGEIDGSSKYLNKIEGVTYRVIDIEEVGSRFADTKIVDVNDSIKGDDDAKAFTKWMSKDGKDYTDLTAFYVYNVETRKIVIYIVLNDAENVKTTYKSETISYNADSAYQDDKKESEDGDAKGVGDKIIVNASKQKDVQVVAKDIKVNKELINGEYTGVMALNEMTFAIEGTYVDGDEDANIDAECVNHLIVVDEKNPANNKDGVKPFLYGVSDKDLKWVSEKWNTVCGTDANATVEVVLTPAKWDDVNDKFVPNSKAADIVVDDAVVTVVATYDKTCNYVRTIKVALPEEEWINSAFFVTVNLDFSKTDYMNGTETYEMLVEFVEFANCEYKDIEDGVVVTSMFTK